MRPSRRLAATALALLVLGVAGCGSNLEPSQVASAQGAGATTQDGSAVAPLPGAGAGVDPGPPAAPGGLPAPAGAAPEQGDPGDSGDPGATDDQAGPGGAPSADEQPAGATSENDPAGTVKGVSCDGFANDTGMSDQTIKIGNASDISGPVPGLFASAQKAVGAYVAYFNASGSTICGRKLEVVSYDSRTDASFDQQAHVAGCREVFAMVGSMSAFDSGGAKPAQDCGLPDVRAISVTGQRTACTTCYAAQPAGPDEFENAVPDFIKRNYGGGQKAAMLYLDAGAAAENGPSQVKFMTKRGMKFVYVAAIGVAEFNYVPFVQAMKDKGVETVQFVGANPQFVRLAQTMQQQSFTPDLYLLDPTGYSDSYVGPAAGAAKDTVVFTNFTPFEESRSNPEVALYLSWLEQVSPGSQPDFFGLFAWSAARLFVQQATKLGGDLDRASLVASMRTIDGWTANDLHAPMRVGAKRIADCWRFIQWDGSRWNPLEGTKYQCNGVTQ